MKEKTGKRLNKKLINTTLAGFLFSTILFGVAVFQESKLLMALGLLGTQIFVTYLIVELCIREHTNKNITLIVVYMNVIAFTSNIRILDVSEWFNTAMTILQSVCAIMMGLYVLSLCRKYFDIEMLDDEEKNIGESKGENEGKERRE